LSYGFVAVDGSVNRASRTPVDTRDIIEADSKVVDTDHDSSYMRSKPAEHEQVVWFLAAGTKFRISRGT
jgi:hypothetical protein